MSEHLNKERLGTRTLEALKQARERIDTLERARSEPIAIIGIGCRYPGGANGPDSFWDLISSGQDAITPVPADRWDVDGLYDPDPKARGKICTRDGGFLEHVDRFDSWFFGVSPKEAAGMDPQQRVFLEVCWEALENAGQAGGVYGSFTGVFAGVCSFDYAGLKFASNRQSSIDPYFATGNAICAVSGRTSYALGLKGPSLSIDTACSSSLVSIHYACQSLRNRECNMALAGGVNLLLTPELSICFSQAGMLSPQGRCRTFDAAANGYVRSEGCGVLVLKRLSDAIAAGDNIIAQIRGSAVNQDGPSGGLTVPSGPAQEEVIRLALASARVSPEDISYVEAHGTGTSLGDPIEVNALVTALCQKRRREDPLLVGAVKTNIGHAEGAAGVAGVIKVALALANNRIPPHLHFTTPNPHLNWEELPVEVVSTARRWPEERKRIAGVSAFGATGTNAHIILAEAPRADQATASSDRSTPHLLMVSAKTPSALSELASRYEAHLQRHAGDDLADVCYSASVGRSHFRHRLAVVGTSTADLQKKLLAFKNGQRLSGVATGEAAVADVSYLFSGQGSQFAGMGRNLYRAEPAFRNALDRCDKILSQHLDRSIISVMQAEGDHGGLIDQTLYTQPALFAFEYALSELWRSWGVQPAAVMGHSVGEYTAACVAGVFSLEDGLALIAARARLMQATPVGSMAAVFCTEAQAAEAIAPYRRTLSIAAVNGPNLVVISGADAAVDAALARLAGADIASQPLQVSRAFHSPLMDGMIDEFRRVAEQISYSTPSIGLVSNVTGRLERSEVANANYWVEHIKRPVMFAAGVTALYQHGQRIFLEVGPKPTLVGMGRRCLPEDSGGVWLPSLRPERGDLDQLLESLGELYVRGASNGQRSNASGRRKVALPTYPFETKRYWFSDGESSAAPARRDTTQTLPGHRIRLPQSDEVRFECGFSQAYPPYIEDHRLFGELVVAGASHLSTLLLAAREALGTDRLSMKNLLLQQAMVIPEGGTLATQIILTPDGADGHTAKLVSGRDDENDKSWKLHVSGSVAATDGGDEGTAMTADGFARMLAATRTSPAMLSGRDVYARVAALGHHLGASFQWIDGVWREGNEIVSRLVVPALPSGSKINFDDYIFYPGLIDSCIQPFCILGPEVVLGERSGGSPDDPIYIPFSIGHLVAHTRGKLKGPLWCRTRFLANQDSGSVTGDVLLYDEEGRLLLELREFRARKLSRQALERATVASAPDSPTNWLHEIVWSRAEPNASGAPAPSAAGQWVILADDGGVGRRLAALLEARGAQCVTVAAASAESDAELTRVFEAGPAKAGLVHLCGLDTSLKDPARAQLQSAGTALRAIQVLARLPGDRRPSGTWLVSAGAVSPGSDFPVVNPQQSPLWGLGRVVNIEQPDLHCVNVDIGEARSDEDLKALCDALLDGGREDQIAFRQGVRYVPRLKALPPQTRSEPAQPAPTKVKISEYGVLDNLAHVPMERRAPGPGEVEISVRATGLNFRDVLRALGMLKEFEADLGYGSSADMTFGFECAGTVVRAGEGVGHVHVGDDVVAVLTFDGSLASFITIDAKFVFPMPAGLGYDDAATLPLAYLTAEYGLRRLCGIKRGDRVLIHAAAGGVGLAAVQIAQAAGADIYATASPSKWPYLQSLGIGKLMNSRTTEFAEEILRLTGGEGVDIVLNSLNGQFMPKSLQVLRHGGTFVEIGKIGIWTAEQVAEMRPDVTYRPFDLWHVSEREPELIRSMFAAITRDLETGTLQPLHHEVFAAHDVVKAFRHMAQAKHIGKIVITQPAPPAGPAGIRRDASYLVTGGLGALGLRVANWLVAEGARCIVLTGRRAAAGEAAEAVEALRRKGARVEVLPADLAVADEVAKVFGRIAAELPSLRGVFHAAGVLEDAVLGQQTSAGLLRVMAPKFLGSWNLHEAARGLALDHFVLFSSAASMLGSAGQANYAAANAFMDGLAQLRQSMGLPAISICWGPWEGAGMAAALDPRLREGLAARGIGTITPERGLATLADLLGSDRAVVGVLPMDWPRYLSKVYRGRTPGFLADLAPATTPAPPAARTEGDIVARLAAAPSGDRRRMLTDYVRAQIASVMGMESGTQIETRQRLFDIGIDSLMAVELRNTLNSSLAISLPSTLVFDYPTLEALVNFLASGLRLDGLPSAQPGVTGASRPDDLSGASAAELAAMLEQELVQPDKRQQ